MPDGRFCIYLLLPSGKEPMRSMQVKSEVDERTFVCWLKSGCIQTHRSLKLWKREHKLHAAIQLLAAYGLLCLINSCQNQSAVKTDDEVQHEKASDPFYEKLPSTETTAARRSVHMNVFSRCHCLVSDT